MRGNLSSFALKEILAYVSTGKPDPAKAICPKHSTARTPFIIFLFTIPAKKAVYCSYTP